MSDHPAAKPKGKSGAGLLTWALWGAALFGVAAVLYITFQASIKPEPAGGGAGLKGMAKGEMAKLVFPAGPTPPPDLAFTDAEGKSLKVADLKGKVVVLNLWATWCAPCVTEMPTLAKLQAAYAGKPVLVVPVSVDSPGETEKAKLFIASHAPLKFYADPQMKLPFALKPPAAGMPTTVIYGADGLEKARVSGGADWSGPDAKALIDKVLKG